MQALYLHILLCTRTRTAVVLEGLRIHSIHLHSQASLMLASPQWRIISTCHSQTSLASAANSAFLASQTSFKKQGSLKIHSKILTRTTGKIQRWEALLEADHFLAVPAGSERVSSTPAYAFSYSGKSDMET